jgi:hypothetical protein
MVIRSKIPKISNKKHLFTRIHHCAPSVYTVHTAHIRHTTSTLCTLCTLHLPRSLQWALSNHLSVCDEPKDRFNNHLYPIICAYFKLFAEDPCHSLQYESISYIDPGGHLWWTREPKINVRFLHTLIHPVQCLREGDWTTFWLVWMILAHSVTVARQALTLISSKISTRKTACLVLPSGPLHPQGTGKHVV